VKIEPEWVADLVRKCLASDWSGLDASLGYPSVSPMFARLIPDLASTKDVSNCLSAETQACKEGLEWLSETHPDAHAALAWQFQRWSRKFTPKQKDHDLLVQQAAALLAQYIDKKLAD